MFQIFPTFKIYAKEIVFDEKTVQKLFMFKKPDHKRNIIILHINIQRWWSQSKSPTKWTGSARVMSLRGSKYPMETRDIIHV